MIIVRRYYCTDRMCGGADCARCHGPGAWCEECGRDADESGCTNRHCTVDDEPECMTCGGEGDEDNPCEECERGHE